ncbi:MAG: PEGA domain-containing protein [Puniceicoccaceae bacterium]|nr:MAG: PEGA domain-containing protein [Puniceicoccaceae bacterium]
MDPEEEQPASIKDAQARARLSNPVLEAADSFGNYKVVKCLTAGLLANYYHMQHVRDLHDVTVGVFHSRTNGNQTFIKRLEALKKMLAAVGHEAFPKIQDCSIIDGRICLFLEPVKGHSLSQYFGAHGHPGETGIGVRASTRLIAQLLGALGYAHSSGLDHRDLDTDLIYVQEDGSVRILGLGIKAAMGVELFESVVSASVSPIDSRKTLDRLSSFDIMSPEYKSGVEEDSRVDVFAVGVIGYWLLTGRKPETSEFKSPTEWIPGLLPNWNEFFEKSFLRDKEKRYQSCKMALLGLKRTALNSSSEGSGYIERQIVRIPVPKGIVARGELASRIYRLIIIGLIGVSLTAVLASFLKSSYSSEDARRAAVAEMEQASQQEIEPSLVDVEIATEPGATVFVVDAEGGRTALGEADAAGTLRLAQVLAEGTYEFLIEKAGYRAEAVSAQLVPADSAVAISAALEVSPVAGHLTSQPEGAILYMNGTEAGLTPLRLDTLIPGEVYQFEIRKAGYRPVSRQVEVGLGEDIAVDFGELVPLSGSVRMEINRAGEAPGLTEAFRKEVELWMNESAQPLTSDTLEALPVGPVSLQLKHPLYVSERVQLNIEDAQTSTVPLTLMPRPGSIKLKGVDGIATQLFINDQLVRLDKGPIEVPAKQTIEAELRMHNYLTMRRTLELEPTEAFVWEVEAVPIPGPRVGNSWDLPYIDVSFAWIPAGQFSMGSPLTEHARLPTEGPVTRVRLTRGFWMGIHELTQRQYSSVMKRNPSHFKGPNRPVENILWDDAMKFCEALTQIEREAGRLPAGYVYRLPTEAEWEYAARAGSDTPFYWGEQADASLGQFNGVYPIDRSDGLRSPRSGYGTTDVGQFAPNRYGLYDMHGNVREWTLDRFNSRLPGGELVDPLARSEGNRVTVRGGGWQDTAARVRSAVREQSSPSNLNHALGFRVVLAPEQ